jgi:hypothetical protein
VYIWQPRFYTVMLFVAQKREHVGEFRPVLQNFYKEWFAGERRLFSGSDEPLWKQAGLSEQAAVVAAQAKRHPFVRALLQAFRGNASVWSHPTTKNEPTAAQLSRFPLNDQGVPYAPAFTVLPVDSRVQADIPEQMIVGSPPREQLYL